MVEHSEERTHYCVRPKLALDVKLVNMIEAVDGHLLNLAEFLVEDHQLRLRVVYHARDLTIPVVLSKLFSGHEVPNLHDPSLVDVHDKLVLHKLRIFYAGASERHQVLLRGGVCDVVHVVPVRVGQGEVRAGGQINEAN